MRLTGRTKRCTQQMLTCGHEDAPPGASLLGGGLRADDAGGRPRCHALPLPLCCGSVSSTAMMAACRQTDVPVSLCKVQGSLGHGGYMCPSRLCEADPQPAGLALRRTDMAVPRLYMMARLLWNRPPCGIASVIGQLNCQSPRLLQSIRQTTANKRQIRDEQAGDGNASGFALGRLQCLNATGSGQPRLAGCQHNAAPAARSATPRGCYSV